MREETTPGSKKDEKKFLEVTEKALHLQPVSDRKQIAGEPAKFYDIMSTKER